MRGTYAGKKSEYVYTRIRYRRVNNISYTWIFVEFRVRVTLVELQRARMHTAVYRVIISALLITVYYNAMGKGRIEYT